MANCNSCGKEIFWQKLVSGKSNPCDVEIYDIQDNHVEPKLIVVTSKGEIGQLSKMGKGRISHFSTCPNAKIHRRKEG